MLGSEKQNTSGLKSCTSVHSDDSDWKLSLVGMLCAFSVHILRVLSSLMVKLVPHGRFGISLVNLVWMYFFLFRLFLDVVFVFGCCSSGFCVLSGASSRLEAALVIAT